MKTAKTILRGKTLTVEIEPGQPTVVIGERCNALGYKSVRESVEAGDYDLVVERAVLQVAAGADIINVNMVGMKVPEREALPQAVERISQKIDAPISIDFGDFDALEAALKIVPGRALINSLNAEGTKLDGTLELARKYNAACVALVCDEAGVPPTPEGRLAVAQKIVDHATHYGLGVDDLIFDAICIGVATDPTAGPTTFETCRLLRKELGANITLGASNVSFGLPKRRTLDASYLSMAILAGMNVPISDMTLPVLKWAILSADVSMGFDECGTRFIRAFRAEEKLKKQQEAASSNLLVKAS
jgi:5-methyltetrahydrofolate--homocysteine methyltransferase